MNEHSGRLVDHKEVVVLVKNGKLALLRQLCQHRLMLVHPSEKAVAGGGILRDNSVMRIGAALKNITAAVWVASG